MPFKSQAQRRWMYAKHPAMAKEWQEHTPKGTKLPPHVHSKTKPADAVKEALDQLYAAAGAAPSPLEQARQQLPQIGQVPPPPVMQPRSPTGPAAPVQPAPMHAPGLKPMQALVHHRGGLHNSGAELAPGMGVHKYSQAKRAGLGIETLTPPSAGADQGLALAARYKVPQAGSTQETDSPPDDAGELAINQLNLAKTAASKHVPRSQFERSSTRKIRKTAEISFDTSDFLSNTAPRKLTPAERQQIVQNRKRWLSNFELSANSPLIDHITSPWRGGLVHAAGRGLILGSIGGGIGSMFGPPFGAVGLGRGLVAGAISGGIDGVMSRRAQNAQIEKLLQRLPEGASSRDLAKHVLNHLAAKSGDGDGDGIAHEHQKDERKVHKAAGTESSHYPAGTQVLDATQSLPARANPHRRSFAGRAVKMQYGPQTQNNGKFSVMGRGSRKTAAISVHRQLAPEEQAELDSKRNRWLPDLMWNGSTSLPGTMSSPEKGAILYGLLGGGAGAALGGLAGHLSNQTGLTGPNSALAGALLGGAAGAGISGGHGYQHRAQWNGDAADFMKRLPPGETYRDFASDRGEDYVSDRSQNDRAVRYLARDMLEQ